MQPVTRHIHIIDHPRSVKGRQLQTKSGRMFSLDPRLASCLVVAPQPFVLERLDHRRSIACCASRNKYQICCRFRERVADIAKYRSLLAEAQAAEVEPDSTVADGKELRIGKGRRKPAMI